MKKSLFYFSILAIGFSSCTKDDDDDSTAPSIKNATINGLDEDISISIGNELNFEALLSDDEALGQFKIDIHDIFDGHSHGKKASTPWVYTQTFDLSGTSQNFQGKITVDNSATAGPYHSILRLIDEAGNESDFTEIDFMILNGDEAQIAISAPDFSSEVHLDKGDTLKIMGQITDNVDLEEIIVRLEEDHDSHSHGKKQEDALYETDFDLTGSSDLTWDFQIDGQMNIVIPTSAESGDYIFVVIVKDNEGNLNIFEGHVHIE